MNFEQIYFLRNRIVTIFSPVDCTYIPVCGETEAIFLRSIESTLLSLYICAHDGINYFEKFCGKKKHTIEVSLSLGIHTDKIMLAGGIKE